ncbi:MAG: hypothetical protein ACI80I_003370 [Akkermansiaceae bacterium]|jgi:hypothetical protein
MRVASTDNKHRNLSIITECKVVKIAPEDEIGRAGLGLNEDTMTRIKAIIIKISATPVAVA